MPVQINEVIIKAVVDNISTTTQGAGTPDKVTSDEIPDTEIAALVLEIIKEKNER
jgi:hypothetical protein